MVHSCTGHAADVIMSGVTGASTSAVSTLERQSGQQLDSSSQLPKPQSSGGLSSRAADPQSDAGAEAELAPTGRGNSSSGPTPLAACAASFGLADGDALQDFLRLARDSVADEAAVVRRQIAELDTDTATVNSCFAAVAAIAKADQPQPQWPAAEATASAAGQPQRSCACSRQDADVPEAAAAQQRVAPPQQPAASLSRAGSDGAQMSNLPRRRFASVAARSSRVTSALPAADTAFFRARSASSAAGTLQAPMQPLLPPPAAGGGWGAAAGALQPWRRGLGAGRDGAIAQAAQLPGHLASFGRDLDAFSRYGSFRCVTCGGPVAPMYAACSHIPDIQHVLLRFFAGLFHFLRVARTLPGSWACDGCLMPETGSGAVRDCVSRPLHDRISQAMT